MRRTRACVWSASAIAILLSTTPLQSGPSSILDAVKNDRATEETPQAKVDLQSELRNTLRELRMDVQSISRDVGKLRETLEANFKSKHPAESQTEIQSTRKPVIMPTKIDRYTFIAPRQSISTRARFDLPTPDELLKAMADPKRNISVFNIQRTNVQAVVELIRDRLDEPRFYPLLGNARLHRVEYECRLNYRQTISIDWLIPFKFTGLGQRIIFVNRDSLVRCELGGSPQ